MRTVMIGTPCYDGRLDVWYTNSLVNTIKMAHNNGIDIHIQPIWVSFDALIQRARNDTLSIARDGNYDDLIWIDSDIEWQPEWFFKLLSYDVDVVGGTYRKKGDKEEYVIRQFDRKAPDPATGLIEVEGLGTGFLRMTRKAVDCLWEVSQPYIDKKDNRERRMAFDVKVVGSDLMSEDIWALETLRNNGFRLWMDPTMTCNHIGPYKFKGDFEAFYRTNAKPGKLTPPALFPRKQL